MLDIHSYWTGSDTIDRRVSYKTEYEARKDELETNATDVQERIQKVADIFEHETGIILKRYSSGWRPQIVNETTAHSGKLSNHILARAGDVADTPDGHFAWWCFHNQPILAEHGLWMEHPSATVLEAKRTPWCHLQSVAPKSGARCYHPTTESLLTWNEYVADGGKAAGGPLELRNA